ncbi:pectin lyase fold/virulence factor [Umbelopsis sp. AD052]|nr:pectin lyase fold/virulence factor [Umbelopsis sp. AD052]
MKLSVAFIALILAWVTSSCHHHKGDAHQYDQYRHDEHHHKTCRLYPAGNGTDDTPNILKAFQQCGVNGTIIFTNHTFQIDQVMNTTNLYNCDVHIHGTLLWSTNITYWVNNLLPVQFQNLSTSWLFGGKDVRLHGYGHGTLDGNGQVWYDWNQNRTNAPGRPMTFIVYNSDNVIIRGLRIVQAQFWSMMVTTSKNIVITDMYVNNTSNSTSTTVNTDGIDVWRADNVTISRWNITCFDDAVAIKGNSSNIYVSDIYAYRTTGFAIGSIGQYAERPDYVTNVTMERITLEDGLSYGAFVKTWSGVSSGVPPNGGGGGGGHVQNVTFRNFNISCPIPIVVTQCTFYATKGNPRKCDTSTLSIDNVTWENITALATNDFANIHCSSAAPCNLKWNNVSIISTWEPASVRCANIANQNLTGIEGSNIPCKEWSND